MRISRREFLYCGAAGAAALGALPSLGWSAGGRRPPNVLFILADDLGWRDTSLYGSTFCETPNIERLARRGMMFTQAYAANPLCSPTRASIMTGLYPARIGITAPVCHIPRVKLEESVAERGGADLKVLPCDSATRLKGDYYTLAEALHDGGYRTGHFGKWHLGPDPYDPLHQGFDVDVPHWPGPGPAGSYVAPWRYPEALGFIGRPGEHVEDRMASEAVKFIRENRDRPFFLNYWCFSVHSPWDAKQELIAKYAAKADPRNPQRHPVYGAMVESMDDAVGTLLKALDDYGLAENTIIVFFSDNGGFIREARRTDYPGVPVTSNAPLRGGKATLYEGGTREPCIVVWPGVVKPGTKSDALIQSIDFYPTLLEMTGVKPKQEVAFDGESIVPALRGKRLKRDTLFCFFPHHTPLTGALPAAWVRKGDWKLIRFFHDGPEGAHRYELYNLRDDPGEAKNLADAMPARVKEMDLLIEGFLKETGAVLPKPNPAYDPSAKLLGGWRAVRNVTLTVKGGLLVGETDEKPAVIANQQVPGATGEHTLEFRMRSTCSGKANAFWGLPGDKSFPAERAVPIPVQHDGEWHEYRVKLSPTGRLAGIRIDPGAGKGRVEIDWIRLRDTEGKLLKAWEFQPEQNGLHGDAALTEPAGEPH